MLITPGRPINSTETATRVAMPCCDLSNQPLFCRGNLVPSSRANIKSTLQEHIHSIFTEENRKGGGPGRSSPLWSGSLQLPAVRRWPVVRPSTSQHSGLAAGSVHPAPTLGGCTQWARGSASNPLGFTTKGWSAGWGVVWSIRGSKKHGLLANLRFWHVLCVTGNSQSMGPLEVN